MELKVPPQEPGRSPSVSETNPTEKEISDDDDDDRNHKHRRRDDARSQSLEGDNAEQVFTNKPYRRTNKSFENGHIYREPGSHSNDTWKNYNFNPTDKRRQGPSDLNQKYRDPGPMRGRGNWNNQHEFASRIVQQGSVPGFLPGRGLPTVSNAYGPSWSAYGLVPGIPNGGIDTLHTLGLQGTYRAINPSMNMGMGLPRQRCRDFEEQGFCLRGDMCPMEHGVNRIVVEDVQSLSQFNLPVSLQNTNLPGPPAPGAQTTSFKSSRGTKTTKRGVNSIVAHDLNDGLIDSAPSIGADFYDPDQPLWGNDSQTSPALQLNQSNLKETGPIPGPGTGPLLDPGPSGCDENTSKLKTTKNRTETKDNTVLKPSPSNFDTSEKHDALNSSQISKRNDINGKNVRRPNQKAQRTVFVSGIPLQQNKKETLISHFCKFGEVVDIHIPVNNDRAFVQFSKREEAEAALKAPDAVMGNRFIRLYWANRDNIPINGTASGYNNNVPIIPPRGGGGPLVSSTPTDLTKPAMGNSPKAKPPPPSQKKLESLEVLKEELRKKQEMLDQKRNDFRRKLDKLAKQATGVKGETETEQVAKRQKLGTATSGTNGVAQASKSSVALRPLIPIGQSVVTNRFKLDNRPTAFKIVSPLPNDLASVAVLKEHFSSFGDFSKVELDDVGPSEENATPKVTACVYFMTRNAAEKAFVSGKSWNGHSLQFSWLKSSNQSPLSTSKGSLEGSVAKISKSGDEESEKVEQMEIDKERTEPEESSNKE